MNRQVMQGIITKLDTNSISLKEAKSFALKFGVDVKARTKKAFIKELSKSVV